MGARPITTGLPGEVFGRLTVVREAERAGTKVRQVVVQCSCGSPEKVVRVGGLMNGTRSCGCLVKEEAARRMVALHAEKAKESKAESEPVTRDPFRGTGGKVAPVVEIFRSDDIRMVRVSCPFCGKAHDHAMPDDVLPTAGLIRSSKCSGRTGGLYQIVGVPGVGEEAA